MRKIDVRARIEREEGGLFRLDIISIEATAGSLPHQQVQSEEKRFFSRAEAKACARHNYGVPDQNSR